MGKKKFDKSKGVTFKLVFRSEDEHANTDQTLSERIFSVIETQKKDADKTNDKERQRILSQFTKEDLGQAPVKKPKAKPLPGEVREPKEAISSHTKGRDDLWITHLMRMKEQAKAELDDEEEEEEEERQKALKIKKAFEKAKEKAKAKAKGKDDEEEEDEEWESCDEEGDEEDDGEDEYEIEEMEIDEEDLEDEEEEKEERILVKGRPEDREEENVEKKVPEHVEKNKEGQQPVINDEDFPDLAAVGTVEAAEELAKVAKPEEEKSKQQELEELAEEEIDLKKVKVKGNVKMKRYDDLGLPMDGYNYYQHIADPSQGGAPTFAFTAQYDKVFKLPEDIDLKKEKMTAEEKEVYEALEYEGEAPVYETLEDDFFTMLTKGEGVEVTEAGNEPAKETKKVTFGDNEIKEILSSKEAPKKNPEPPKGKDGIYSRKDFQKVLKQHVNFLKDKYKEEREKNRVKYNLPESDDEEEDVEEVDESFDEDDEENRPDGYIERLKFEDDVAAQEAVAKSLSDLDSSFEEEERQTRAKKEASTRAMTENSAFVKVRHAKLNIIKEGESENKKRHEEKDKDGSIEVEEEEEEEEQRNKVEEVFKKREKGETKEEKKQRKAAIKQFKQERKDKKKKFKENFENKKKEQVGIAYRQTNNLQGLSVYKLTV